MWSKIYGTRRRGFPTEPNGPANAGYSSMRFDLWKSVKSVDQGTSFEIFVSS
jgi:hypothetical protein